MPSLGADMESGVLVQWMVKPGDTVKRGDIIAVIGTDKADVEAEVFESGVIEELIAKPGEKLPVGTVLRSYRIGWPRRRPRRPGARHARRADASIASGSQACAGTRRRSGHDPRYRTRGRHRAA
ncbi:MAG: lipoyl domain-containing protein [Bryobacteraceae bacterium]